jgi:hypothetical protein
MEALKLKADFKKPNSMVYIHDGTFPLKYALRDTFFPESSGIYNTHILAMTSIF